VVVSFLGRRGGEPVEREGGRKQRVRCLRESVCSTLQRPLPFLVLVFPPPFHDAAVLQHRTLLTERYRQSPATHELTFPLLPHFLFLFSPCASEVALHQETQPRLLAAC
jgi:hypothetical protein